MFCELRAATVCGMRQQLEAGFGELLIEYQAEFGWREPHLSMCTKQSATCGHVPWIVEDISRGGCRMASLFDDEHAHLLFSSYSMNTDDTEVRVPLISRSERPRPGGWALLLRKSLGPSSIAIGAATCSSMRTSGPRRT